MDAELKKKLCEELKWRSCPDDITRFVFYLFANVTSPELVLSSDGLIEIPHSSSVKIEESNDVYKILRLPVFEQLPLLCQKNLLDLLYFILRKSTYDVVRFRCCMEDTEVYRGGCGLIHTLLILLEAPDAGESVSVRKRITRLLGVAGGSGISPSETKRFLALLKEPSALSLSLLQALNTMVKQDDVVAKASPSCFFNFGGVGSKLTCVNLVFPFVREYQIMCWFRVDQFPPRSLEDKKQFLVSFSNTVTGNGMSLYIEDKVINVDIFDQSAPGVDRVLHHVCIPGTQLRRGCWYNIAVKHWKPRLSFFSKDELVVMLDQQVVFQDAIKYPAMVGGTPGDFGSDLCTVECGKNFNGQMSAIYFLNEALPPNMQEVLSKTAAGKAVDAALLSSGSATNTNSSAVSGSSVLNADMAAKLTLTREGKSISLEPKMEIVFHPSRCRYGYAFDIHGRCAAKFGPNVHIWEVVPVREVLMSIGGVAVLLPLWPYLLVEQDEDAPEELPVDVPESPTTGLGNMLRRRLSATNAVPFAKTLESEEAAALAQRRRGEAGKLGLGSSIVDIYRENDVTRTFTAKTLLDVEAELQDITNDGVIGLLIHILARCLRSQNVHQAWMIKLNGLELIEYALQCAPVSIMSAEDPNLVLALMQLRASVKGSVELDRVLIGRLLCNFKIWCSCSPKLQTSLMSVTIAAIRAQPDLFTEVVGVQRLLDHISACYLDEAEEDAELTAEYAELMSVDADSALATVAENISVGEKSLASPAPKNAPSTPLPTSSSAVEATPVAPVADDEEVPHTPVLAKPQRRPTFKMLLTSALGFGEEEAQTSAQTTERRPSGIALDGDLQNFQQTRDAESVKRKARCAEIAEQLRAAKAHRGKMRGAVYEMINIIALQSCKEKDVKPIIDFIGDCKDLLVMNEVAQLLLCLIVEGGGQTVTAIIEACRGADEFGAFILFHFLNKSVEHVRSTGVRLLTHFYMRMDGLPTNILNMRTRPAKTRKFVARAFDAISNAAGTNESQNGGLSRMAGTGGLLLLTEFMLHYCDDSTTEQSYMALLEMLLTRSESSIHTNMTHENMLELNEKATPGDIGDPVLLPTPDFSKSVAHRSVIFTVNLMHPDLASDESLQLTNNCILPVFFTVLPKLPQRARERVYGDLLALLKHGVTIRQAFVSQSSWHICMYELMAHLIVDQSVESYKCIGSHALSSVLNKWGAVTSGEEVTLRGSHDSADSTLPPEYASDRFSSTFRLTPKLENSPLFASMKKNTFFSGDQSDEATLDLNFAIGMKITATLLLHSMEMKSGWREILFTLGQSYSCKNGVPVSLAVLSQVLSELTFTMKSKYKNLQHMAKSTNSGNNSAAMTKLENLLSLILICGLFTIDAPAAPMNLPHYDIAQKRAEFIDAIERERSVCKFDCSDELHGKCLSATDLCRDCGHSLSVHPKLPSILEEAEMRVKRYVVEGRSGRKPATIPAPAPAPPAISPKSGKSTLANMFNDLEITIIEEPEDTDFDDSTIDTNLSARSEDNSGTWRDVRSMYHKRSMVGSLGSFKSTSSSSTLDKDTRLMDMSHCWFDLSMNSGNPPERAGAVAADGDTPPQKKSLVIHDDELIRPIERNYGHVRATLVLTLQNLRFFDSIFWPHTDAGMRNISMLKYQNDFGLPSNLGGATTILSKSATTSNMFSASTSSATSDNFSMTLYSATLRMSLFVLQELSPFSDMAELNLRRMRILLSYIDKVPSFSFSMSSNDDWLLVVVVQVTVSLQRIASALGPVFDLIFSDSSEETRTRGAFHIPHVYGDADDLEAARGAKNLASEELDAALGKPEVRTQVECLFNNDAGRRLIAFIRSSVHLLVDCFEIKQPLLLKALPEATYVALTTLVAITKNDTLRRSDHTVGFSSPNPTISSPVMFGTSSGGLKTSITGEYVFSNNLYANSIYVAAGEAAIDTLFDKHHAKKESFASRFTSSSAAGAEGGRRDSTSNIGAPTPLSPAPVVSSAVSSENLEEFDVDSDDEEDFPEPVASPPVVATEEVSGSSIHGDVTVVLRWLKCLYLESDVLRGDMMVGATMNIEQHEADSLTYFQQKLKTFGHVVNCDAKEAVRSMQAEVSELTEVASNMSVAISSRETNRQMLMRNQDMDRARHVASSWHSCLKQFDLDWSPWKGQEATTKPHAGDIRREISNHSDSLLRRMMFTKLDEPVDHSNCAYLETKQKMNQILGEVSEEEKTILIQLRRRLSGGEALDGSDMGVAATAATKKRLKKKTGVLGATVQSQEEFWGDVYDVQTAEEDSARLKLDSAGEPISNLGTMFSSAKEEKRPAWIRFFPWAADEKVLLNMSDVCDIKSEQITEGTLLLTNKCLYFQPKKRQSGLRPNPKPEIFRTCCWSINRITEMYGRRYLLQNCAIELFHLDATETLLAFNSSNELAVFFRALRKQLSLPLICTPTVLAPKLVFSQTQWTDLWRRRVISNFEYLMHLNKISGRSYNDLTQYPVMPWVIADYKSKSIDFSSMAPGKVFRDLTRPVGALNPSKLKEIMERYNTFDMEEEKFMYGSHYSSAGVCMYFLIRQEPFTTLSVALQGGRFDCPDRLFFDLSSTWTGVQNSMSDVKELIPEMYCFPECLINSNRLPLGELQTLNEDGELVSEGEGQVVDHVVLPDWCNNDPYEFIRLHREALESEYVSMNLHHWIDLIFGCKQKGQAAIDAYNVFYYLTYENALSTGIDSIEDDLQREAIKAQVTHFGQTPSQLFAKPHPQRVPCSEVAVPICSKLQALHDLILYTLPPSKQLGASGEHGSVISISIEGGDKLVVVYADLSVGTYRWSTVPDYQDGSLYQVRPDKIRKMHPSTPAISSLPTDSAESFHRLLPDWPVDSKAHKVLHYSCRSADENDGGDTSGFPTSAVSPTRGSMFGRMISSSSAGSAASSAVASPAVSSSWWGGRGRSASVAAPTGSLTPPPSVPPPASNRHSITLASPPVLPAADKRPRPQSVAVSRSTSSGSTPNRRTLSGLFASTPDQSDADKFAPLTFDNLSPTSGDGFGFGEKFGDQRSAVSIVEILANRVSLDDDEEEETASRQKKCRRSVGLLYREFTDGKAALGAPSRSVLDQVRSGRSVAICGAMAAHNSSVPVLLSCGYWDNSIRINNLDSSLKEIGNVTKGHLGQVSAICSCTDNTSVNIVQTPLTAQFAIVVTGGIDGTCRVWMLDFEWYNNSSSAGTSSSVTAISSLVNDLTSPGLGSAADGEGSAAGAGATSSPLTCIHILWGHDTPITTLCYSSTADLIVSASSTGLICIHTARKGSFVRTITECIGRVVNEVYIAPSGYIVVFSSAATGGGVCASPSDSGDGHNKNGMTLHVFWLNGELLCADHDIESRITIMKTNGAHNILVCATDCGIIEFRALWNLEIYHSVKLKNFSGAITALYFSEDNQYLFIGADDGSLTVCSDPSMRMQLMENTQPGRGRSRTATATEI